MARELRDPYPSCPGRPGEYILEVSRKQDDEATIGPSVIIWCEPYAVKRTLDLLLADDDVVFETQNYLRSSSGLRVRYTGTDRTTLKKLHAHEYSVPEMGWTITEPRRREILAMRSAPAKRLAELPVEAPRQGPREKTKVKASRSGLVTIQQIADELKVEPRDLRVILRKMKTPKPAAGWAWPVAEVDSVKEMLSKAVAT